MSIPFTDDQGRRSSRRRSHEARSSHLGYVNGDVATSAAAVDSVDLFGLANSASRMSNQSDMRPWDSRKHAKSAKKKQSYDEALHSLAATLPLVSSVSKPKDPRVISTAPRGRRGSKNMNKMRSRSNDQARSYIYKHTNGGFYTRENSLDARLRPASTSRPESPFKVSGKSRKAQEPPRVESPPCTCDEDTVMEDHPMPVSP